MMTHGYSQLYLSRASRTVGNMLHIAVMDFDMDGGEFLKRFIQSDVAEQIENGNAKYIAGKSGTELFLEVIEKTSDKKFDVEVVESYNRSPAYWVGWMLTHYQWYSGKSFRKILDTVPFDELLCLYNTLHEADIQKSYEVLDLHFNHTESRLKHIRKLRHMTQEKLAKKSEVPLNTIRSYERKSKNINKAQIDTIMRLSKALSCDIEDILE